MQRTRARLAHLQQLSNYESLDDPGFERWSRTRLDRLLVDYMIRQGMNETGKALAQEKNIEELVDLDVFAECHRISDALLNGSSAACLAWCTDNRSALRKIESGLEFELRLQEYIELIRDGRSFAAVTYMRKHLVPHADRFLSTIQRASALLAFPATTTTEPFAVRIYLSLTSLISSSPCTLLNLGSNFHRNSYETITNYTACLFHLCFTSLFPLDSRLSKRLLAMPKHLILPWHLPLIPTPHCVLSAHLNSMHLLEPYHTLNMLGISSRIQSYYLMAEYTVRSSC